jgi:hypothetical protein
MCSLIIARPEAGHRKRKGDEQHEAIQEQLRLPEKLCRTSSLKYQSEAPTDLDIRARGKGVFAIVSTHRFTSDKILICAIMNSNTIGRQRIGTFRHLTNMLIVSYDNRRLSRYNYNTNMSRKNMHVSTL